MNYSQKIQRLKDRRQGLYSRDGIFDPGETAMPNQVGYEIGSVIQSIEVCPEDGSKHGLILRKGRSPQGRAGSLKPFDLPSTLCLDNRWLNRVVTNADVQKSLLSRLCSCHVRSS